MTTLMMMMFLRLVILYEIETLQTASLYIFRRGGYYADQQLLHICRWSRENSARHRNSCFFDSGGNDHAIQYVKLLTSYRGEDPV
jgi:hypothetical protein